MKADGRCSAEEVGSCMTTEEGKQNTVGENQFWDENSGSALDPGLVRAARAEGMQYVREFSVYDKVTLKECRNKTGKGTIAVRWVDINKGDDVNPDYRSRLVAKEIKRDKCLDLFAATPPLEALEMLLCFAMTEGIGYQKRQRDKGHKIEVIDIKRVLFMPRHDGKSSSPFLTKIMRKKCAQD